MRLASAEPTIALPAGEARIDGLLGAWSGSGAFVYGRGSNGRFLAVNNSFARKLGHSAEELVGREVDEFVHPEDVGIPVKRQPEQRWLTSHGWRWITWEESLVRDRNGGLRGTLFVGHDTTRQRLVEEQFYKLSQAFDQAPVSMVITDIEGRVQYVNARFTATTGLTLEQILDGGRDVLRDGHPDDLSYAQFRHVVNAGNDWKGELKRKLPDGSQVWESVHVSCLRGPGGTITNLLCLREDITARKLLEERLRQSQKMESLGTLAGGIAHDFNNLLAIMSGYAELCQMRSNDQDVVQRTTTEILRATQRAIGLVQQILAFSRKGEIRFKPVDLSALIGEITAFVSETFPRNIRIEHTLDESLPPLRADQNQLQQIILNLCVNARDAMPDGGAINITTSRVGGADAPEGLSRGRDYACLRVSDTGTGMSPEVRARIFEPFFTTKQVNKGTGLGLSVVYGIVASHEGLIDVESTPGSGSSFLVYIPLAEAPVEKVSTVNTLDFPGGTESLLVVDDETTLLELLHVTFAGKGYSVTCASDGIQAISFVRDQRRKFDAVILDLNMPGATGLEVLKAVRASRPGVPALVVTGHLSPEVHAEFERIGQHHFLHKPYTLDQLGRRLRTVIDES